MSKANLPIDTGLLSLHFFIISPKSISAPFVDDESTDMFPLLDPGVGVSDGDGLAVLGGAPGWHSQMRPAFAAISRTTSAPNVRCIILICEWVLRFCYIVLYTKANNWPVKRRISHITCGTMYRFIVKFNMLIVICELYYVSWMEWTWSGQWSSQRKISSTAKRLVYLSAYMCTIIIIHLIFSIQSRHHIKFNPH